MPPPMLGEMPPFADDALTVAVVASEVFQLMVNPVRVPNSESKGSNDSPTSPSTPTTSSDPVPLPVFVTLKLRDWVT